jgi:hypothetical protein
MPASIFWTGSNQFGVASQTAGNWQQTVSVNANAGFSQSTLNWFNQTLQPGGGSFRFVAISEARVINPGEFNDDGIADTSDYVVWRRTMGTSVARGVAADGDGDGTITLAEYNVWRAKCGTNYSPGSGAAIEPAAIPEPATGVLALAILLAMLAVRRRPEDGQSCPSFLPPQTDGLTDRIFRPAESLCTLCRVDILMPV